MRKNIFYLVLASVVVSTMFVSCGHDNDTNITINPEFRKYITAFTSGVISKKSVITIQLAKDNSKYQDDGKPIAKEMFDFNPSVDGKAYWISPNTIEFHPDEDLPSGQNFICEFHLSKIINKLPDNLKEFKFDFQTISQSYAINFDTYKPYEKTKLELNKIPGTITTADIAKIENVKKILQAKQNGKDLSIAWEPTDDNIHFKFFVENVVRKQAAGKIYITYTGNPIGAEQSGDKELEIPSLSDFKVLKIDVVQQPDQCVVIDFSDPLKETQNLNGLISIDNLDNFRFSIVDNQIKVYTSERQKGTKKIVVESGIKNIMNFKMKNRYYEDIVFEDIKPAIRFLGKGVIIPSAKQELNLPFQSVNLSAVNVKIIQIFENNIAQFLQINKLDGESQLKRVGRIVHKETIQLKSDKPIDYGKWNTFSIDLSKLIKTQIGAIYRIELSFTKSYSLYPCDDEETIDNDKNGISEDEQWESDNTEASNWDYYESYYDDYYYDDYYDSDYSERDNPCSKAYYRKNRFVSRNILASDMGIIAKAGTNNNFIIAVTNLKTTKPISGVTLDIYNFQNQLMNSVTTDDEGFAKIKLDNKPYLIMAKNGDSRGYLRVDDGSSLSLSNFDVSGAVVQKGIKGFIYGERGVWRPGDSLFLMFIVEDPDKLLPANHPVEFKLTNPHGQLVSRIVKMTGVNGFYTFNIATDQDAPTGNWYASIKVGGATFGKTLKIETIKPNRLKINLDFAGDKITSGNSLVSGKLKVKWLSGATAGNLKAKISATLSPIHTTFKKYEDYIFDDHASNFHTDDNDVYSGKLDDDGNANLYLDMGNVKNAPGMLKAYLTTRVFEKSGDFSIDRFSIPYSPFSTYVGIKLPKGDKRGMLLTDTNHTIQIVTLNEDGNPVTLDQLQVEVYKVQWRWWWSSGSDNLANYVGSSYHQPIIKKTIYPKSSKSTFDFRIDYPEWGRYLIRVTDPFGGHSTGKTVYVDWPGWAGRAQRNDPEGATMLIFNAEKEKYNVGEKVKIDFPSSQGGRALVSIESGSKIIDAYWVGTQDKETSFEFTATSEMTPNVFVNITLVQPYQTTANDLPIRLYGVIPITVDDPQTKLHPEIKMPDVLAPEENVTIQVSEKDGKAMTYTIAVVDEGLLDLTRFATPDPWNSFYAHEALGVKTWDMYDYVLGAYGGKIARLFAIGGGGELDGSKGRKANRFKPMVKFFGPFQLKKGKINNTTFKMPKYIGSVRTMVIAGNDGAYGNAEKTIPVRKPLMVLATFPRVVGPGESVMLPVTVFAMEKNIKNVSITVKTNNFFTGEKQKSVTFDKIGDQVINFELQVAEKTGIGKIQVYVKSGNEKADYEFEIAVRNPNPPVTDNYDAIIQSGQSWTMDYTGVGVTGTNSGVLEISNIPPIDFGRRLKYLLQYPYGCIEQTTSSAFPQLYLENVMDVDNKLNNKISDNIKATLKRLKLFQLSNGGFSYWPGESIESEWGTNYAGHFMLEAEKKGYLLPIGLKKQWIKYQKQKARNWEPTKKYISHYYYNDDIVQAYRLYTLALADNAVLSAMNRLREKKNLSVQARWRLAAAYVLSGKPEVAKELTANATTDIKPYHELSYSYGSDDRDRAMILETMSLMNEKNKAIPIMKMVSKALSSSQWMSTQTTAYCLIGIATFAGNKATSKQLKFTYNLGNEKKDVVSQKPVFQKQLDFSNNENGTISLKNNSDAILYVKLSLTGVPVIGDQTFAANNLKLTVKYLYMNGNQLDVTQLQQGTDFMAEVTVYNPGVLGYYKEMALTTIFPSGWEIHNTRMDEFDSGHTADKPRYMDIRDDRIYSFFDVDKYKKKTFYYTLNATYLGKFYMPTISCEAMYDHEINARVPGKWIEVVEQH